MKRYWEYSEDRPLAGLAIILAVIAVLMFWMWILVNDNAIVAWIIFSIWTALVVVTDLYAKGLEADPKPESAIMTYHYRTIIRDGVEVKIPLPERMPMPPKAYR